MAKEIDLALELRDDLGEIELAKCVVPGVYYVVAADPEEIVSAEYYIVDKECRELSSEAKTYGEALNYSVTSHMRSEAQVIERAVSLKRLRF